MKRIFTVLIVLAAFASAKAQPWFDIGVKAGVGTSFMYNTQIFEDQKIIHQWKPGYAYGGKFGFNFSLEHQLVFDIMQTSFKQGFKYTPEAGNEISREFSFRQMDYLVLYRYNSKGTYFEFGPQLSKVSKAEYTDEGIDYISPYNPNDMFNKDVYSVALGFGSYIFGTDNFGITAGFRLNYTLNDIVSEAGRTKNIPMLYPGDADPTRNLGIMFILEANFDFGYIVSPSCGTRRKLFMF